MKAQIEQLKEARKYTGRKSPVMTKEMQPTYLKFMKMHDKAYKAVYRQFLPEKVKIQDLNVGLRELNVLYSQLEKFFKSYKSPRENPKDIWMQAKTYLDIAENALDKAKWNIKERDKETAFLNLDIALTNLHNLISMII